MTLTEAKCVALGHYTKKENTSVFVAFPSQSIFLNNTREVMEEFASRSKQTIICIKYDGKIVEDSDKEIAEDIQPEETVEETVSKSKKLKKTN